MSEEEEEQERGFKIEDKRRFDARGEARDGEDEAEAEAPQAEPPTVAADGDSEEPELRQADAGPAGELTFSSFAIGLASQAFMFLGLAPDPQTGMIHKDLGQAQAMIGILSMLAEKTVGNLSDDESHMMEELLYELRMSYVREIRGETGTEEGQE